MRRARWGTGRRANAKGVVMQSRGAQQRYYREECRFRISFDWELLHIGLYLICCYGKGRPGHRTKTLWHMALGRVRNLLSKKQTRHPPSHTTF